MAKILYGLSGQGFGHSTRSKETIRHLIDAGHEIKIFTYGQALFMLKKDFDDIIYEIPGLTLSYKNNRLVYSKTILDNTKKIIKQARHWNKISKEFSAFNPDIIITDFQMPILNGLEFVQKLRGNGQTSDIPVVMLTARGFSIDDEQKKQLNISECLSKPFSPRELLMNIEDILHSRQALTH